MGVYGEFVQNEYHKISSVANEIVKHCASDDVLNFVKNLQEDLSKKPFFIIEDLHTDNALDKTIVVKSTKIPQWKIMVTTKKEHPLPTDFETEYYFDNTKVKNDPTEFIKSLSDIDLLQIYKVPELRLSDYFEYQQGTTLQMKSLTTFCFDKGMTNEQITTELLNICKALDDRYDIDWGKDFSYDNYPEKQKDNPGVALMYVEDCITEAFKNHTKDEIYNDMMFTISMTLSDRLSYLIFHNDVAKTLDGLYRDYEIRADWKTALQNIKHGSDLNSDIGYCLSKEDISNLAEIHRDNRGLRKKIEDLLTSCNFHYESGEFNLKHYDEFIIRKEDNEKPVAEELEEDEVER